MPTRQTPEARRQAVLEAALGVFARHGFDAATTEDIARAAGLSKGGLYWHFKSKDEILAAILRQLFDHEMQLVGRLVEADGSVAARLRQMVAQTIDMVVTMEQAIAVALGFYGLAARDAEVRQWLQGYYQHYHALLSALLEQGFVAGELRAGTADTAAVALIALLEGLGLLWAVAPQLVDLRVQSAAAVELFLRGLGTVDT